MLDKIFSVDIYKTKFTDLAVLAQARDAVNQLDFSAVSGEYAGAVANGGGLDTLTTQVNQKNVHTFDKFKPLGDFIEQEGKKYWDLLGYYPDVLPKIRHSWVNITNSGGLVSPHNHCRNPIVAVFYLEANDNCGNIVFENPMELILGGQPIKMPYKNFQTSVKVTTGDVVIFPGYLKHYTEVNNSNSPRVTFVVNLAER
jgi:uncharacterized protein (TIGR02466 family)